MCQVTLFSFACSLIMMRTNMSNTIMHVIGQDKSWIHDVCRENTKHKSHHQINSQNLKVGKVSYHKNIHKLSHNSLFSADLCNKPK